MGQVAYSIAEAAATTAVSETTIITEIREGRLASRNAGTTRIILHCDLIDWANGLPVFSSSTVPVERHLSIAT